MVTVTYKGKMTATVKEKSKENEVAHHTGYRQNCQAFFKIIIAATGNFMMIQMSTGWKDLTFSERGHGTFCYSLDKERYFRFTLFPFSTEWLSCFDFGLFLKPTWKNLLYIVDCSVL